MHGGLREDALEVEPDLERALDRGLELTPAGGELVVLPTYTAMLELQRLVTERGLAAPYWERSMRIRVGHLYPEYLNIYADRGNIAVFERRSALRGHELEVSAVSVGDQLVPGEHDLLYIGGGQDREQALIAPDLAAKGDALKEAVEGGAAVLAVCGGYQLLGRGYRDRHGGVMPGVGLFPHETVAGERRMIGDVLLECELEPGRAADGCGLREPRRPDARSMQVRSRSAASSRASGTTATRASRAAASAARSARTCTAPSSPGTRGSPTGSSRRRSRTPPAATRRSSSRCPTGSRPRRMPSRRAARENAAAASKPIPGERGPSGIRLSALACCGS